MIKTLFLSLIACAFPWIVFLIEDNPGGALVALIMQASIIGWLPASLWALKVVRENHKRTTKAKKAKESEE